MGPDKQRENSFLRGKQAAVRVFSPRLTISEIMLDPVLHGDAKVLHQCDEDV